MGTPDYLSPEQSRSLHKTDIRSDLYSLGCTFYFLLTGQVPFPGGTPLDKLIRHATERPRPVERRSAPTCRAAVVGHRREADGQAARGPLPDAGGAGRRRCSRTR